MTILALGMKQSWRGLIRGGRRPDFIVFDDVEASHTVRNPRLVKERIEFFLRDAKPAMEKHGVMILAGNLFSRRAAITRLFEQKDEFSGIKRFSFNAIDEAGLPVWPEKFSYEDLEKMRRDLGSARFEAEYMNNPSDEGTLVKPEDVKYFTREEMAHLVNCGLGILDCGLKSNPNKNEMRIQNPKSAIQNPKSAIQNPKSAIQNPKSAIQNPKMEIAGFYDPSATSGENSDYQAFITVGRIKNDAGIIYYVLDSFIKKCKLEDAVRAIYQRAKRFSYNSIGAETNVFKEWLEGAFSRIKAEFGFSLPLKGTPHRGSKAERIKWLAPLIENGSLRFLRGGGDDSSLLVEQILYFDERGNCNDDGPDALAAAIKLWEDAERAGKKREPGFLVFPGRGS